MNPSEQHKPNQDKLSDKVFADVLLPPRRQLPYQIEIMESGTPKERLQTIISLHSKVHGNTTVEHLLEFVENQKNLTVAVASDGDTPIGYMIGYELKPGKYLNWMVGVDPDYRRQGIASELMHAQQDWARQHNYKSLRTESSNLWQAMLILNIRFGFKIIGTYTQGVPGDEPKIVLEKEL